eukprot:m.71722 g.71722  ORF g.71722 m.71722 type:complete len:184 (+) comp10080_c0_seq1:835-1386(+)
MTTLMKTTTTMKMPQNMIFLRASKMTPKPRRSVRWTTPRQFLNRTQVTGGSAVHLRELRATEALGNLEDDRRALHEGRVQLEDVRAVQADVDLDLDLQQRENGAAADHVVGVGARPDIAHAALANEAAAAHRDPALLRVIGHVAAPPPGMGIDETDHDLHHGGTPGTVVAHLPEGATDSGCLI